MLADAVLKTLKYFDVQDHALTLIEVSKYLLAESGLEPRRYQLSEIQHVLEQDLRAKIGTAQGFYFLAGRENLVQKRLENNFYASKRQKRAKKYLPRLRFVPFILAAAVDGSEALSSSKLGSDIDLLIITAPNRIWLGRLAATIYFQLLGLRRHGNLIADRFCLNHYVAAPKRLDADQNLYTAIEYTSQIPYFGGEVLGQFLQRNLDWIEKFLHQPEIEVRETPAASWLKIAIERLFANSFGNWLEKAVGKFQLRRIHIQDYITVGSSELSFHPGSKGQQILKKAGF